MKKGLFLLSIGLFVSALYAANHNAVLICGDTPEEAAKSAGSWGGGIRDTISLWTEFWTDTYLMWEILWKYAGFKFYGDTRLTDHIHVIYGDGIDWYDPVGNPRYRASRHSDWNDPDRIITDTSAYCVDVENIFAWLRDGNPSQGVSPMTDEDMLFCWTFDHGSWDTSVVNLSYLCLMSDTAEYDLMVDSIFASYVDQVPCWRRIFWMQQCHSGGFIDDLSNTKTVTLTASKWDEFAHPVDKKNRYGIYISGEKDFYGGEVYSHGEFNFHIMNLLRGDSTPGGEPFEYHYHKQDSFPQDTMAKFITYDEIMADSLVSMEEAFSWVWWYDSPFQWSSLETPQYDDSGAIGNTTFLDAVPPAAPTGLTDILGTHQPTVILTWNANTEPDLAGYNLYRKDPGSTEFYKRNIELITSTYCTDRGEWKKTFSYYVTAVDLANNESNPSNIFIVTFPSRPPSCPFIYTWNGSEFVEDNNILIPSDTVVTDYYKIQQPLVASADNTYDVQLRETGREHSWFDKVELLTVDHPENIEIGVTVERRIFAFEDIFEPVFCVDNHGEEHLSEILSEDGVYFEAYPEDTLTIGFWGVVFNNDIAVGITNAIERPKRYPVPTEILAVDGVVYWQPAVYLRENHSTAWATATLDAIPDTVFIILTQEGHRILDEVYLTNVISSGFEVQSCPLNSATHSIIGDVKDKLLATDSSYVELWTAEEIEIGFDYPAPPASVRDFILVSTGHYITEPAPKTIKEDAVSGLEEFKSWLEVNVGEETAQDAEDALNWLNQSLTQDWWVDDSHLDIQKGKQVFDGEMHCGRDLMDILEKYSLPSDVVASVKEWIQEKLVKADRLLALIAFKEAKDAGLTENNIDYIEKKLADGYSHTDQEKFDKAIICFREAWDIAVLNQQQGGGAQSQAVGASGLPRVFSLSQNHPNPFTSKTQIRFALPRKSKVSLNIYDISGRLVKTLVNGTVDAGYYTTKWDAKDFPIGVYFARFEAHHGGQAGDFIKTKKLVLMR